MGCLNKEITSHPSIWGISIIQSDELSSIEEQVIAEENLLKQVKNQKKWMSHPTI